jgi:hypothetical protein
VLTTVFFCCENEIILQLDFPKSAYISHATFSKIRKKASLYKLGVLFRGKNETEPIAKQNQKFCGRPSIVIEILILQYDIAKRFHQTYY